MEHPVVILSDIGVPQLQIAHAIEQRFSVGISHSLAEQAPILGALPKNLAEALNMFARANCDISVLMHDCYDLALLIAIDEYCKNLSIVYVKANLYLRARWWNSWGHTLDGFYQYEQNKTYYQIIQARANVTIDLDKVMKNTDSLEIPKIDSLLDKAFASIGIHSSRKLK